MPTEKLNLPTITGNLAIDVQKDLNALAQAVDKKAGATNGLATLNQEGKVPSTQLDISAPPDATTTTKGIVKLNDSTDSTSTTEASTANAGRKVSERVTTHSADDTSHVRYGVADGINIKTVNLDPAPIQLIEGLAVSFKNTASNTGASTLNINGLGAKLILKSNGKEVSAGNLKAGSIYTLRYDGTSFILQGEGGSGNLQPSQALAGFTFSNDEGEQVGIGDSNLVPGNIKNGISIFGVKGTSEPAKYLFGSSPARIGEGESTTNTFPFAPRFVLVTGKINGPNWTETRSFFRTSGILILSNAVLNYVYGEGVSTSYAWFTLDISGSQFSVKNIGGVWSVIMPNGFSWEAWG